MCISDCIAHHCSWRFISWILGLADETPNENLVLAQQVDKGGTDESKESTRAPAGLVDQFGLHPVAKCGARTDPRTFSLTLFLHCGSIAA